MRLEETTFRPLMDRWIARDGTPVVLRATAQHALILEFVRGVWHVTSHAVAPERPEDARAETWRWRGRSYRATGEVAETLSADDPDEAWLALYESLTIGGRPAAPNRRNISIGAPSSCAFA